MRSKSSTSISLAGVLGGIWTVTVPSLRSRLGVSPSTTWTVSWLSRAPRSPREFCTLSVRGCLIDSAFLTSLPALLQICREWWDISDRAVFSTMYNCSCALSLSTLRWLRQLLVGVGFFRQASQSFFVRRQGFSLSYREIVYHISPIIQSLSVGCQSSTATFVLRVFQYQCCSAGQMQRATAGGRSRVGCSSAESSCRCGDCTFFKIVEFLVPRNLA